MTMLSPSLACDPSIATKLVDFLPASVVNVAIAFSFVAMQPAWNNYFPAAQVNPFTYAMNVIGDLFSSFKPKEILVQLSPTPTIKGPPTPTLQYQPESTSSIVYAVALCFVLVLVGALFTVLRNNTVHSSSATAPCSTAQTCNRGDPPNGDIPQDFGADSNQTPSAPSDDPIDPSNCNAESEFNLIANDFSQFIGDIGGSPPPPPPPSFTTSGMADDSDKSSQGFWAKLKMFLMIFVVLASLTHGGHITQKIRSLAIRDDLTFSYNNASVTPYLRQASELVATKATHLGNSLATFTRRNTPSHEVVEKLTVIPSVSIPSAILQIKYNEIPFSAPSEHLSPSIRPSQISSGSNAKYSSASFPLPTKYVMTSIPTSVYPIGQSVGVVRLGTPTTSNPSKVTWVLTYIKMFTTFLAFCILIPIMSFVINILPAAIQFIQLSKSKLRDQRETCTRASDGEVMKLDVDVNEDVLAIEVVENSKVDTNIVHDEVVPLSTFMDKGKGKALETIEENDETTPCLSSESLDLTNPTLSTDTLTEGFRRTRPRGARPTHRVRMENKRRRKAEEAAIAALLDAVSPC